MSETDSSQSSGLSSVSSDGEDVAIPYGAIEPYRFEPEFSTSEEDERSGEDEAEEEVEAEEDRMANLDWCRCGNCQIMDRIQENKCCLEINQITDKNNEVAEPPPCITQHPGFTPVCVNRWVLQTAWYQYRQQYPNRYEGPEHKLNRHIAYRQLVRWCWGILGKEIRVVLPACAVSCIRAHFPPPGLEEDFIFEGFHFADE